jgi:RNA polymerase sigma factor (TIGR02999 family)
VKTDRSDLGKQTLLSREGGDQLPARESGRVAPVAVRASVVVDAECSGGNETESNIAIARQGRLSSAPVTELLAKWGAGDEEALRDLVPLIYQELRRLAHRYLQGERPDHTLRSTALVHEAYLRLSKQKQVQFQNRAHFFAVSAQLMRQILVEYARKHGAAKRGGGCKVSLEDAPSPFEGRGIELVALDDALKGLAQLDAQQSWIVECVSLAVFLSRRRRRCWAFHRLQ